MRISVNLASQPYVELRPVYNRLRTWMAILALTGVALWFLYRAERSQAQDAMAHVAAVQHHVQELEQERSHYQAMMQEPKNAAILQQSDFLNGLFRRKAFSWTATMTDLETVLPTGVQVLSLDPIVAKDGQVTIRLRVTGARDRALDLVRNLEKSRHFASPRLASETLATNTGTTNSAQPVSDTNMVNFDILADYRPLPLPQEEKGKAVQSGEETKRPESHSRRRTVRRKPSPEQRQFVPGAETERRPHS